MTDYSGVNWRVNYGEIAEREQFRVGYVGQDSYEAYFEVSALTELIDILSTVQPFDIGLIAKGVTLQAQKVDAGHTTAVVIEPLSGTNPEQIMRLDLGLVNDLIYALQLFQTNLPDVLVPEDWDFSDLYLFDKGTRTFKEKFLPDWLTKAVLDARFEGIVAGLGGLNTRVEGLETLTGTGRLSDASLTTKITNNAGVGVRDVGVIFDGSAPTGAALQAAMNSAVAFGYPLRLPMGRYLLDQVNTPDGLILQGSGPDTVLVQRLAGQPTLQSVGTYTEGPVLTETLAKGATTINVSNTYVAGDLIIVRDTAAYVSTDAGYKSGEMLEVLSATSSVITLKRPVRGSFQSGEGYTVANGSRLTRINRKKNVTIRDVAFECHPDQAAPQLRLTAVENVQLSGITVLTGQNAFCILDNCKDVDVSRFTLNIVDNWATSRPGYGFAILQSCYNVKIHDGFDYASRHAVTTIGGAYGIPRLLEFYGITSTAPNSTAGIDTHAAGEGIQVYGNLVTGNNSLGITCRARNMDVHSNKISQIGTAGIIVTESARDIRIHHNGIDECGYGVRVGSSTFVHYNIEVAHNEITRTRLFSGDASTGRAISISGSAHENINVAYNLIDTAYSIGITFPAQVESGSVVYNTVINASTGPENRPCIDMTGGTSGTGSVDVIGNVIRNVIGAPSRAINTTRTAGRMVLNVATGAFLSTGTEFNAPVGWTKLDNKLYA